MIMRAVRAGRRGNLRGTPRTALGALFAAYGISLIGTAVSLVAVPWYVLATTGSPAATGFVGFATVLGMVVAGLIGGSAVDRLGHRRASIAADLVCAAATAAIPLLDAAAGLAYWQFVALAVARSFVDALGGAARLAMLPELAAAAGTPLVRVNSLWATLVRSSTIVGGPVAGILVATAGAAETLLVDAGSFLLSGAIVLLAVPRAAPATPAPLGGPAAADAGGARGMTEGVRRIMRDPVLASITFTLVAVNFMEGPLFGVILPVHARGLPGGGSVELGVFLAAVAAGGTIGTLLFALVGPRLPRRPTFVASFLLVTICMWGLALAPNAALATAALFCSGIAAGPVNPLVITLLQERVPAATRARTIGATRSLAFGASPLGILLGGLALQAVSVRTALLAVALVYVMVTAVIWGSPSLRGGGADRPAPFKATPRNPQVKPDPIR